MAQQTYKIQPTSIYIASDRNVLSTQDGILTPTATPESAETSLKSVFPCFHWVIARLLCLQTIPRRVCLHPLVHVTTAVAVITIVLAILCKANVANDTDAVASALFLDGLPFLSAPFVAMFVLKAQQPIHDMCNVFSLYQDSKYSHLHKRHRRCIDVFLAFMLIFPAVMFTMTGLMWHWNNREAWAPFHAATSLIFSILAALLLGIFGPLIYTMFVCTTMVHGQLLYVFHEAVVSRDVALVQRVHSLLPADSAMREYETVESGTAATTITTEDGTVSPYATDPLNTSRASQPLLSVDDVLILQARIDRLLSKHSFWWQFPLAAAVLAAIVATLLSFHRVFNSTSGPAFDPLFILGPVVLVSWLLPCILYNTYWQHKMGKHMRWFRWAVVERSFLIQHFAISPLTFPVFGYSLSLTNALQLGIASAGPLIWAQIENLKDEIF